MSNSDIPGLTPAMIAALRTRQIAFLAERLTDDRAKGDFIRSFAAGYDHVLEQPLNALIDPKKLVDGLSSVATNEAVRGFFSPIAREINRRVLASIRADDVKLGEYVSEDARAAIAEIVARPDLVPDALIHKVFDDDATEEIMRDIIYDALVEFNESVNPFFADWGLPALIKRFMPIGSGAVLKSMSAVRAEFDKRLEPEMRKFLLGFSRKSKKKVANLLVSSAGDPQMVALRQNVVMYLYEETLATLTKNIDDDARMNSDEAVEGIVLEVLRKERPRARLLEGLELLLKEHGDAPLSKWLERIGVTARPDLEKVAELYWPFLLVALKSPAARAFYERVTWDFYASVTPLATGADSSEDDA